MMAEAEVLQDLLEGLTTAVGAVVVGVNLGIGIGIGLWLYRRWSRTRPLSTQVLPPCRTETSHDADEPAVVDRAPASYQRSDVRSGFAILAELEKRIAAPDAAPAAERELAQVRELIEQHAAREANAQRETVDELLNQVGALRLDRDNWRKIAEDWGKEIGAANRRVAELQQRVERWQEAYNETCLERDAALKALDEQTTRRLEAKVAPFAERIKVLAGDYERVHAKLVRGAALVERMVPASLDGASYDLVTRWREDLQAVLALAPRELTSFEQCEQIDTLEAERGKLRAEAQLAENAAAALGEPVTDVGREMRDLAKRLDDEANDADVPKDLVSMALMRWADALDQQGANAAREESLKLQALDALAATEGALSACSAEKESMGERIPELLTKLRVVESKYDMQTQRAEALERNYIETANMLRAAEAEAGELRQSLASLQRERDGWVEQVHAAEAKVSAIEATQPQSAEAQRERLKAAIGQYDVGEFGEPHTTGAHEGFCDEVLSEVTREQVEVAIEQGRAPHIEQVERERTRNANTAHANLTRALAAEADIARVKSALEDVRNLHTFGRGVYVRREAITSALALTDRVGMPEGGS